MKIAFSNIAWDAEEEPAVLELLTSFGIGGIELAPTKCWQNWIGITPESIDAVRARYGAPGFAIPSLQAILYGRPELQLFGSEETVKALCAHMERVAQLAGRLGARVLVFGAPSNRDPGALAPEEAIELAVPRLRSLGDVCARYGVCLGIEANPKVYQCRFVTRWFEATELVRKCDSAGVRLHLDSACTAMEGDDLDRAVAETTDILQHVHISEPNLGQFGTPTIDHARFAAALKRVGYTGWCSVEMRRAAEVLPAVRRAAEMAMTIYG